MQAFIARQFAKAGAAPNTFIGGIAKTGGTGVNAPIDTPYKLSQKLEIDVNRITGFRVNGDDVACRIRGNYKLENQVFYNNANITYFRTELNIELGTLYVFRNCANLYEINIPNATQTVSTVSNSYMVGATPKLEVLNLNSVVAISNNMIRPNSLLLTEMHLNSVTTIARKGIRLIPNVTVINLKKLKTILTTPASEHDPFIETRSDAILNVNSFLATSNSGGPDASLVAYKAYYPLATVNFYDDAGNYVSTL